MNERIPQTSCEPTRGTEALLSALRGKKILIYGLGREGRGSFAFLKKYRKELALKRLALCDGNEAALEDPCFASWEDLVIERYREADFTKILATFDLCLKAPGISLSDEARLPDNEQRLKKAPHTVISGQIDLFLNYAAGQIVGVTGTKGKSTTTSLFFHLLQTAGKASYLLGNIGIPAWDELEHMEGCVAALELSCHQLEFASASPGLAILTNLYPEHLDHYPSYEAYCRAKVHIALHQKAEDFFFFRTDQEESLRMLSDLTRRFARLSASFVLFAEDAQKLSPDYLESFGIRQEQIAYSALLGESSLTVRRGLRVKKFETDSTFGEGGEIRRFADPLRGREERILPLLPPGGANGRHMLMNAAMTSLAACFFGLDQEAILRGLRSFRPLRHRFEFLGKYNGIEFINDSIATIPQACFLALQNAPHTASLIIGGEDRGIDYGMFGDLPKTEGLRHVFCLPEAGHRIMKEAERGGQWLRSNFAFDEHAAERFTLCEPPEGETEAERITAGVMLEHRDKPICLYAINNMHEAVAMALALTPKGKACLLSPAAASYNQYRNFEERGDDFAREIREQTRRRPSALLLMNPEAGRGLNEQQVLTILRYFNDAEVTINPRLSRYAGDMGDCLAQEEAEHDCVACLGGDGSLRECAAVLAEMNPEKPLVYLPGGTTCDYARTLGLPLQTEASLENLRKHKLVRPDLGYANGEAFIYVASFGAFTDVSYTARRELKRNLGSLAYFIEALKSVGKISAIHCRGQADGVPFEGDYLFGAVMNSLSVGGLLNLESKAESVSLDDGCFEVLLIRAADNHLQYPGLIAKLLTRDYSHELIEFMTVRTLEFLFDEAIAMTLDGEFARRSRCWNIDIRRRAFSLLVPENCTAFTESVLPAFGEK